jgi:hypothetical protein
VVVNKDASVNALMVLDLCSKALPDTIEDSLDEIRYLFAAYLDQPAQRSSPPHSSSTT